MGKLGEAWGEAEGSLEKLGEKLREPQRSAAEDRLVVDSPPSTSSGTMPSCHPASAASLTSSLVDCAVPLTGPALKLVVERCEPHRVVAKHVHADDACELIHYGTTLVQEGKTLADILAVCFAAVTYHELYKLAARDAFATLQEDAW